MGDNNNTEPKPLIQGIRFKDDMTQKKALNLLDGFMLADSEDNGNVRWATLNTLIDFVKVYFEEQNSQIIETVIEPGTTAEIPLTAKDKEAVFLNFYAKKIPTNDIGEPDNNQELERMTGYMRILNYNKEPKINDFEYSTENNNEGLNIELDLNDNNIILKITAETNERIHIKTHIVSAL